MSFAALAWAAKQRPGNLAAKMVLLGLANYADEHGRAYPSTAALAEFGDMDHKTATAALDRLVALGLIDDTGERAGRTKQVKIYGLRLEQEATQKRKPTENGSLPDLDPKDPQKRGTDTITEPVIPSEAKASSVKPKRAKFVLPDHIPAEPWRDFTDMRRRIGKPMTVRAMELAVARLDKLAEDGWPPGECLNHSTLNNYQGIFPPKDQDNGQRKQRAVLDGIWEGYLTEAPGIDPESVGSLPTNVGDFH